MASEPRTFTIDTGFLGTLAGAVEEGEFASKRPFSVGDRIHHYRLLEKIGEGGMGVVFKAEHIYLKQTVAIKAIKTGTGLPGDPYTPNDSKVSPEAHSPSGSNLDPKTIYPGDLPPQTPRTQNVSDLASLPGNESEVGVRFLREAQALAILNGPNVLKIQDASEHEGIPYFVTELLDGMDLSSFLKQEGRLTKNQVMDLLEQVGGVLTRQEKHGIFHRDIKPTNIWVRPNGTFCLIDYGVAGIDPTGSSRVLFRDFDNAVHYTTGTPGYMSPEQAAGTRTPDGFEGQDFEGQDTLAQMLLVDSNQRLPVHHSTDLFSLGITAWECLAGQSARDIRSIMGQSASDTAFSELHQVPIRCCSELREDLDENFLRILRSLTEIDLESRYDSAATMIEELEGLRYGGSKPYGATFGTAFVALPFTEAFDDLFHFLVEVCGAAKLAARRVDRVPTTMSIWEQIEKELRHSSLVIAVFTPAQGSRDPNANVLTEAAHARAIGKEFILLSTEPAESLPFDWRHLPIIRYENSQTGMGKLREELLPRLRRITRHEG